ncbi:CAMK family protein kinase [Trichomonas vaginalis G3]|uniref:CAMK family protein kinase n=1 Tax=Trichomonas vaginalis (strain ATCC PRA-98 / G3) TaxID=412133 RepID=A2F925_TRIV3|nr:peptidyl-threonine phosphorylation [Trichomonas vaginalis G3]EAX98600.1 CAMK family protein kinase [Trichomonas vaginalis G3]KAI5498389.1 peptidyl-threonine phosphorylation [Trichomonas vaginalis G3]|eukprot:XP_001311530.1 CAMK family protein kinase [Trichomonas vaginalis G3]
MSEGNNHSDQAIQDQCEEDEYEFYEEEDDDDQDPNKLFEYDILQEIGQGAFAKVFLIRNRETDTLYAAKAYSMFQLLQRRLGEEPREARFFSEVKILSTINHKNCLKIIELIKDDVTHKIYLIVPYAGRGPLSPKCWEANIMDEKDAKDVFKQLAEGIQYLHNNNIVHRDIKPDNVLIQDDGNVMLCDFSVSKQLSSSDELVDDTQGTPAFRAPEEQLTDPFDAKKSDVWSYGISLYVMIFGHLPYDIDFENDNFVQQDIKLSQQILNTEINLERNPPISQELKSLFQAIFVHDPKKRPSISEVLKNDWFKST